VKSTEKDEQSTKKKTDNQNQKKEWKKKICDSNLGFIPKRTRASHDDSTQYNKDQQQLKTQHNQSYDIVAAINSTNLAKRTTV